MEFTSCIFIDDYTEMEIKKNFYCYICFEKKNIEDIQILHSNKKHTCCSLCKKNIRKCPYCRENLDSSNNEHEVQVIMSQDIGSFQLSSEFRTELSILLNILADTYLRSER